MALYRVRVGDTVRLARGSVDGGPAELLPADTTLDRLLAAGAQALGGALDGATDGPAPTTAQVLAPLRDKRCGPQG